MVTWPSAHQLTRAGCSTSSSDMPPKKNINVCLYNIYITLCIKNRQPLCLASTPDSEPGCCPLAGSACFIRFSARPTVFSHPSKITYPLTLKGGHTPRKRELTITFDRISQFMDPTILYYIGSYSDILSSIFHADPVWFGGWFGKNAVFELQFDAQLLIWVNLRWLLFQGVFLSSWWGWLSSTSLFSFPREPKIG